MLFEVLPTEDNAPLSHVSAHWGSDIVDPKSATLLAVGADEVVTGVDASLAPGAYLGGSLTTDDVDPNVGVDLYAQAELLRDGRWIGQGRLSRYDGAYLLSGLPAGTYRLHFNGSPGSINDFSMGPEYWPNAIDEEDARTFTVGRAGRVVRDAALVRTGEISGRLTTTDLPNGIHATVTVLREADEGWEPIFSETLFGAYVIRDLPPGTYRVKAAVSNFESLAEQYWSSASEPATAAPVVVRSSSTTSGVDVAFVTGATITGSATFTDREPASVWVVPYRKTVDGSWLEVCAGQEPDAGCGLLPEGVEPRRLSLAVHRP